MGAGNLKLSGCLMLGDGVCLPCRLALWEGAAFVALADLCSVSTLGEAYPNKYSGGYREGGGNRDV